MVPMRSVLARLLLIFVFAGTLAPVGLAVAVPPCACCTHKACPMHHPGANAQPGLRQHRVSPRACAGHCSSYLIVPQWAQASLTAHGQIGPVFSPDAAVLYASDGSKGCSNPHAVRGPPKFFLR